MWNVRFQICLYTRAVFFINTYSHRRPRLQYWSADHPVNLFVARTANMCMGNTTKSCIIEIPWKVVSFIYFYSGLIVRNTVCMIKNISYNTTGNTIYPPVLGTVKKWPKSNGKAWKTFHHEKLYFWQSNICSADY